MNAFEKAFQKRIAAWDRHYGFQEAALHSVRAGGKRFRPKLVLLLSKALGTERTQSQAIPAACALEAIHTYSLIHDDLPSMDNDDLRRGQPTLHKVVGEGRAILVGDALLTEALGWCADAPSAETAVDWLQILTRAAGARGMVYGQWMDLAHQKKAELGADSVSVDLEKAIVKIHQLKTGALFAAVFALAVATVRAKQKPAIRTKEIRQAEALGTELGVCFQEGDDLLDISETSERLGKTAGKDEAQGKLTWPSLYGFYPASERLKKRQEKFMKALEKWLSAQTPKPTPQQRRDQLEFVQAIQGVFARIP
ncbi:MAG: polyprenyl synthetase family protein [Bdellovibrionales bacterium]|nr:polyprenyl synthetase family protein [Bdellovibrionales bacterium]